MCNHSSNIGPVGEAKLAFLVELLQYRMPDHRIVLTFPSREGVSFDRGIDIDGELSLRVQVKTTEKAVNGKMVFSTCKSNGRKYTNKEANLMFFYCIESDWSGIALPSECGKSTKIYNRPTKCDTSYRAEDFEFFARMKELINTSTIEPVAYGAENEEDFETEDDSIILNKQITPEKIFDILVECSYSWDEVGFRYNLTPSEKADYQKMVNDWITQKSA